MYLQSSWIMITFKQYHVVANLYHYSWLRLIEPPWDRPFLALISAMSYYLEGLFTKKSQLTFKGGYNKRRDLLTSDLY